MLIPGKLYIFDIPTKYKENHILIPDAHSMRGYRYVSTENGGAKLYEGDVVLFLQDYIDMNFNKKRPNWFKFLHDDKFIYMSKFTEESVGSLQTELFFKQVDNSNDPR